MPDSPSSSAKTQVRDFGRKVCHYFRAFLETDFKRHQAPRRRIQLKNDSGFRTAFPLRKYPTLFSAAWALAARKPEEGLTLRIAPRQHVATVSATLRGVIKEHVDAIPASRFEQIRQATLRDAEKKLPKPGEDVEGYVETMQVAFAERVGMDLVGPLLSILEGTFRTQAYSAIESVYEVESDLVELIARPVAEQLPSALGSYIVRRDLEATRTVLTDFFSDALTRDRLIEFFSEFATADAFSELRDLMQYMSTGPELQLYLYFCEARFATHSYPLFYLPVRSSYDEVGQCYELQIDPPHLYVNKRAIDFIQQELAGEAARNNVSPVQERILYLDGHGTTATRMEDVLARLVPAFGLPEMLKLQPGSKVETAQLRLATGAHLAVFDKADESLINDFEALLAALDGNAVEVEALFQDMVEQIVLGEPPNIEAAVDAAWNGLPVTDRLVAVAPIPVSEEQQKILAALRHERGRFIQVVGPPGTGKSHTITAIAFDCIMREKSCLILSDKKEALDVVQDKLEQTLAEVRYDDDSFPNPILRLGKGSQSNYPKLVQQQARQKIERHVAAHRSHANEVEQELTATRADLVSKIDATIRGLSGVPLARLRELHRLEAELEKRLPGLSSLIAARAKGPAAQVLAQALTAVTPETVREVGALLAPAPDGLTVPGLEEALRVRLCAREALKAGLDRRAQVVELFPTLSPAEAQDFLSLVAKYERLRMPLFGFLFRKAAVMQLNAAVGADYNSSNTLALHKRLVDLQAVAPLLGKLQQAMEARRLEPRHGRAVYKLVAADQKAPVAVDVMHAFVTSLVPMLDAPSQAALRVGSEGDWHGFLAVLINVARFATEWAEVQGILGSVPSMDYVGQKGRLQSLYTSTMAHALDQRFLGFVRDNAATAKTLGTVIKKSEKFPSDAFGKLQSAMPCIIASIREFAEYVPLAKDVFDVVIIDEGSQVSVAQAFPALLRARKVVVFGDPKQFSNVQSMQASIMTNQGYLHDLRQHFVQNISSAADRIARLEMFDVKKSVLDFMDLIKSFGIMLRKHFRSYPELISFSSRHFYNGELQAIKVRGKPIEDVIRFTVLTPEQLQEAANIPDGKAKRGRNTNVAEAQFILAELRRMIDEEEDLTVGVITPHTEQQAYLTRLLFSDPYYDRFVSNLRLKIMTFDSCQGEERQVIFYSMVATVTDDKLNYIFPVEIDGAETRVEEMLKMQRLNVGFSRAMECIHFVLSKPVDEYRGSARRVLQHYWNVLTEAGRADPEDTDPNSPMERRLLGWLEATQVYQLHRENIEVIPQFQIGAYLRQLDPAYQHPAYRVDFLLRYAAEDSVVQIVIEYDGLKEHFERLESINAGNYEAYYRESDLERQFVLESYGYRFLRVNRFNLGADPVATLDARLKDLLGRALNPTSAQAVNRVREQAENLHNGDAKTCSRCERVLPVQDFFDPDLAEGEGGYGRICMGCKGRKRKAVKVSSERYRRLR